MRAKLFIFAFISVGLSAQTPKSSPVNVGGGGGGGTCPAGSANAVQKTDGTNCAASSITDNGSTVVTTEPLSAPSFTGTGSNPFINFPSNPTHTGAAGDLWNNAGVLQFGATPLNWLNTNGTPGAGILHVAGSTQTATSSTIATADIAANAVTSAKMAVVNTRHTCDIPVGDTTASAITNAQLGPQSRICYIPYAATIVEMDVNADGGTPNVIVGVNHAGSISNIVSSALATASSGGIACSNTGGTTGINGATTCSSTLQNTSIAAGDYLELVSGTAGGVAKFFVAHVIYTIN